MFHGKKTDDVLREIAEWIRQGQGEDGQHFTPETSPHRVPFNGNPISAKEPKGGEGLFLQDAERNAAYFGKNKPGYFMYIGPGSEKTWNFEMYPDDPKEMG